MNLVEMGGAAEWARVAQSGRMHWLLSRKQPEMRRIARAFVSLATISRPNHKRCESYTANQGGGLLLAQLGTGPDPSAFAYYGSSIALRPASVICTRMISIARPPTFTVSPCMLASPLRTRSASISAGKPSSISISMVLPRDSASASISTPRRCSVLIITTYSGNIAGDTSAGRPRPSHRQPYTAPAPSPRRLSPVRRLSSCALATRLIQPAQDLGKLFRYSLSNNVGVHRAQLSTDRDHDVATELHPGTHLFVPSSPPYFS